MLSASATFGAAVESPEYFGLDLPHARPVEECEPISPDTLLPGGRPFPGVTVHQHLELRPVGGPLPFAGAREARLKVWLRLREERPVDHLSASMLADAAAPSLYAHLTGFAPMPSAEITMHFAPFDAAFNTDWVLGDFRTAYASASYAVEDGELWSRDGRLIL